MINIHTIPVTPYQQLCRIICSTASSDAVIIDPGGDSEEILHILQEYELQPKAILVTHAHIDHVGALKTIRTTTQAPVFMHKNELPQYQVIQQIGHKYGLAVDAPTTIDHFIQSNEALNFLGLPIKVLFTPGHTAGGCSFYFPSPQPFVVVGDTLFAGDIGRTDLTGGSLPAILESIRNKLYTLPNETRVLCGHGDDTTIGDEKKSNPECPALKKKTQK
jgi:hydroxyacylglutathione hydrolase